MVHQCPESWVWNCFNNCRWIVSIEQPVSPIVHLQKKQNYAIQDNSRWTITLWWSCNLQQYRTIRICINGPLCKNICNSPQNIIIESFHRKCVMEWVYKNWHNNKPKWILDRNFLLVFPHNQLDQLWLTSLFVSN